MPLLNEPEKFEVHGGHAAQSSAARLERLVQIQFPMLLLYADVAECTGAAIPAPTVERLSIEEVAALVRLRRTLHSLLGASAMHLLSFFPFFIFYSC